MNRNGFDINAQKVRNIGVVAHVDAGKTTTTEHMLFLSGKIRSIGRVDDGTSQTDWLDVERQRGISVRAASITFSWRGETINLIDTPGHVDFSSEVERSLRVLDGAILIVSAVEGVQAHTETLWHGLRAMRIPTLIFVNKLDRIGADPERVLKDLRSILSPGVLPVQEYLLDNQTVSFRSEWPGVSSGTPIDTGIGTPCDTGKPSDTLGSSVLDKLAEADDELLEQYMDGLPVSFETLDDKLRAQVRKGVVFPVLYGCAMKGIGIESLLNAVIHFLPQADGSPESELSGVVFRVERDKQMGKLAFVRLYGGTVHNRDTVRNWSQTTVDKITQIRKVHAQAYQDVGRLAAGDIGVLCGLSGARVGDILGSPHSVPTEHRLATPLLTVEVRPSVASDYHRLYEALQELNEEDPVLDLQWDVDERVSQVKVMGTIQLEILASLLRDRFGIEVTFGPANVIYQETPKITAEGFVAYTMPKPCWAILRFLIEPGPRGSGLVYAADVREEDLLLSYQNEVARRVPEALTQGLYGWQVTDLKVTLIEGEHHVWHTHPLDFVVATPMGIMDGLRNAGTKLLEPVLTFRLTVPEEFGGRVLHDLSMMRATFDNPTSVGGRFVVEGVIPLSTSIEYAATVGSFTGGRGTFVTRFDTYTDCPDGFVAERRRRGVNPLDTAKYILSVRNALS